MVEGAHATHVASIAAGNRGVCRHAQIAGVLISLPREDEDRRLSFYDSSRLADAVDYLLELGDEPQKPVAINISLATNGHAHDGSSAVSRWIDAALATSGRAVIVAAGNSGQERGESESDIGFVMGRIHSSGTLPAAGLERDLEWVVVGNGVMDVSENELEIWFSAQDRIAVSIKPPGKDWIGPVEPRQHQNRLIENGTMLSVHTSCITPANGLNYISVYLSRSSRRRKWSAFPRARGWSGCTRGKSETDASTRGSSATIRSWLRRVAEREAWAFPSFTEASLVDDSTVSSLVQQSGHHGRQPG
jgi:hypothetical protein